MRILLCRTRIGLVQPSYAYRAYIPFSELSPERQALISMHSDYGHGAGPLARLPDVIAPMHHLEAGPGLDKHRFGGELDLVAGKLGAVLLRAAFPEMLERTVPFRLLVPIAPPNARRLGAVTNLSGRYQALRSDIDAATADSLGFTIGDDR